MPVFTAEIATAQETTMPSAVDSPFSLSGPHALALSHLQGSQPQMMHNVTHASFVDRCWPVTAA
jgi:hypothetical protein